MVYVPFQGFIRFSKEGAAQRVVEALKAKNDGKVVIRDVETTLRVLEGMYGLQLSDVFTSDTVYFHGSSRESITYELHWYELGIEANCFLAFVSMHSSHSTKEYVPCILDQSLNKA